MIFAFRHLEGGYSIPKRIVGANIPYEWLIYIFMLIPLGLLVYGVYKRVQVWRTARKPMQRNDLPLQRVISLLIFTLGQKMIVRKPLAGWMHFLLFWGFVFLFLATAAFAMWDKIGFPPMTGAIYVWFSAIVDILGAFAMLSILVLAFIRYFSRPDRLNDTRPLDGWILLLIFAILFSGYVIEGMRIAGQIKLSSTMAQIDYERLASPVGWYFAIPFKTVNLENLLLWHRVSWWSHMLIAFIFIAMVPFTKLWHIFTGMIEYYVRDLGPGGLTLIENIEEAETFGAEKLEDFGWKDLLDLDACIRCGRCQEACPTYNTGKALNPKLTLIQAMKKHMDKKAPYMLEASKKPELEE